MIKLFQYFVFHSVNLSRITKNLNILTKFKKVKKKTLLDTLHSFDGLQQIPACSDGSPNALENICSTRKNSWQPRIERLWTLISAPLLVLWKCKVAAPFVPKDLHRAQIDCDSTFPFNRALVPLF